MNNNAIEEMAYPRREFVTEVDGKVCWVSPFKYADPVRYDDHGHIIGPRFLDRPASKSEELEYRDYRARNF
jgi:hypothetical protein